VIKVEAEDGQRIQRDRGRPPVRWRAPVVESRRLATSATAPGNGTGPRGLGGRVT
jgi:hypothetical protein